MAEMVVDQVAHSLGKEGGIPLHLAVQNKCLFPGDMSGGSARFSDFMKKGGGRDPDWLHFRASGAVNSLVWLKY